LEKERIPKSLITKHIWEQRFKDINAFEHYLSRNGIVIRKFFLHLSKKEQKKRFLSRLEDPEKNWKFSAADIQERAYWDGYMKAYQELIEKTASKHAPWYVVPADNKWYARLVVAAAITETLEDLKLDYPKVGREQRKQLLEAKKTLQAEKD
jgi:polyphosphate kinase 2 (PPK2 family)